MDTPTLTLSQIDRGGGGLIILDLEWNRGYDKTPLDEILQIGAVKLERPGGPIVSTFCAFIRPKVHKKLNRTAKLLPEVEASLRSALDFPTAYREFVRWCGEDTHFAAWGCDDLDTLAQNCAYWRLPPPSIGRMSDLQTAFSLTLGTKQNIALWWAAEYCQVPDSFTFHNALHDAVYTASLIPWISPEALELSALDRRALRLLRPPSPLSRTGPPGPIPPCPPPSTPRTAAGGPARSAAPGSGFRAGTGGIRAVTTPSSAVPATAGSCTGSPWPPARTGAGGGRCPSRPSRPRCWPASARP